MSLYDDEDMMDTVKKEGVAGWGSGIKLVPPSQSGGNNQGLLSSSSPFQSKPEIRRQVFAPTALAFRGKQNNNSSSSKGGGGGRPSFPFSSTGSSSSTTNKLSSSTTDDGSTTTTTAPPFILPYSLTGKRKGGGPGGIGGRSSFSFVAVDPDWQFENEYDPYFPNEYEKALKELRDRRDKEAEEEESKRKSDLVEEGGVGLGGGGGGGDRDDDDYSREREKVGGVAIAPPPSLSSHSSIDNNGDDQKFGNSSSYGGLGFGGTSSSASGGSSAAAKIMAKYGYKEGSGLGKSGQGVATALQVEKTGLRMGRIIHENTPKEGMVNILGGASSSLASYLDDDDVPFEVERAPEPEPEPIMMEQPNPIVKSEQEQYAEEQLKNPSKVLLLKNMVGPADVDDELEPEVKEECQKFGEVITVTVFQMPDVDSEDSIRIFVEFTQVSSAIKAFMELNGRFFGGRQVRASFYDPEKFNNFELTI